MENKLKQKQIEEMARDMCADYPCNRICDRYCGMYDYAERAINAGYRKIPENAWLNCQEFTRKETAEKYHELIEKAIESVPNATKEFIEAWKSKNDEIAKELTEGLNSEKH